MAIEVSYFGNEKDSFLEISLPQPGTSSFAGGLSAIARMPGTNVPGVITAGTFYQDGKRVFWDVHHPEKTIMIDPHDERYNESLWKWMILRRR